MAPTMRTSIHGRRLGLSESDALMSNDIEISSAAVDASITIAASQTSPRTVVVQLKAANGAPIAEPKSIEFWVFLDALGVAWAVTGGSTGLADDTTAGASKAVISKLLFAVRTDATGKWSGTWTDTAHEVAFLGVRLPNGRVVYSPALTTA